MTELGDMVQMLVGAVTALQQLLQQHFQPSQPQKTREFNSRRGETQQGKTSEYRRVTEDPVIPMKSVVVVRQFLKLKPPTFKGGMDPVKAKDWILAMEKNFRLLRCGEQQKVEIDSYLLAGEASRMIVADYERPFTNLAEYAPHLVATDEMRARRFEDGLRHEIRRAIRPLVLSTYADVLDKAIIVEQDEIEMKNTLIARGDRILGPREQVDRKKQKPELKIEVRNEIKCFHGNEVGHIRRNCPRLRTEVVAPRGGPVGGNVRPAENARPGNPENRGGNVKN
ncbi:hypothetical protein Acr_16g0008840 [Actinidia rufa]|uniref:Retrotransposon gag domain-containing protein n=1 Tax=Actinidia rufa TaxID=165716 RepID=A0A7J0G0Y8_9ERIC|nr:hypothetical protein Acr_16g0008840 [Actinidia rufa]